MKKNTRRTAIGVDYGTNSVRAVVVDVDDGTMLGSHVFPYPTGRKGIVLDDRDPNLARQHPADYIRGFAASVRGAVRAARADTRFDSGNVVGIGIDTTGSTPIPVSRDGTPLALSRKHAGNPAAMAWLWKDHTAHKEAGCITDLAGKMGLPYLEKCGGTYSSEWFWSKILRCRNAAPRVFDAAYSWVELCDFVPAHITGNTDPTSMARSVCAAGHKALYSEEWSGLPEKAFLKRLSPDLAPLRDRLYTEAVPSDRTAGRLTAGVAKGTGLPAGIPVAVGGFDAHHGAVGAGVKPGSLVKIMGTSTCDILVSPGDRSLDRIPGICGVVPGSVVPGMYGLEAGQSAVGDIFSWFIDHLYPGKGGNGTAFERLTGEARRLEPGESGLMALDWNNGNRTVLADPLLTGLLVGQTLHTTAAEVFRALVEATAFGALTIINRFEEHGVAVSEIVACGGIAEKNDFVMQLYADVCGRPIKTSRSAHTSALGAAIFGAVAGGAHNDVKSAQKRMACGARKTYRPRKADSRIYARLYEIYSRLHDEFGARTPCGKLGFVMKDLLAIRAGRENGECPAVDTAGDLKRRVYEANAGLAEAGLVILTWGNVSGRDPATGAIVIKPSGVPYGDLSPSNMVTISPDGAAMEKGLRPSTDTPTHAVLYRAWKGIGGIAHVHSPYATAFAQAERPIPCLGTTHADYFHGEVPVTRPVSPDEAANDYEGNTGRVILERLEDVGPDGVPAVLVARHGAFTWGETPAAALENAIVLEETARMAYLTLRLKSDAAALEDHLMEVHHLRKHGAEAYYGQEGGPHDRAVQYA